jgi:hypothetical protein
MEIIIKPLTGKIFSVRVLPQYTIARLKTLIQLVTGSPCHQQRLLFKGHLLEDCQTVSEAEIIRLSMVYVIFSISKHTIGDIYNTRQIFVKFQNGKIMNLDVKPYNTIDEIKSTIQQTANIPYWQHILRFNGKVLEDEGRTLLSYNVYNGGILHLNARRRWEGSDSGVNSPKNDISVKVPPHVLSNLSHRRHGAEDVHTEVAERLHVVTVNDQDGC